MEMVGLIAQVIVGLGILNVWILRFHRSTEYRGGTAKSMREEFEAYGLPVWFMYAVGTLKITLALMLLAGVWLHVLVFPAAIGMAVLMAGAIAMHLKVKDAPRKFLPATVVLVLCILAAMF